MKKIAIMIVATASVALSAFTVINEWIADEKAATVKWEVPAGNKMGTFEKMASTIEFDKKNLAAAKINAVIVVNSVKAGNPQLEAHLLSPDYFDAEKFPKISFTSTEVTAKDTWYIAKGKLNMKDSTKVIEFPFTFTEDGASKGTFSGTMTINSADYGVMKSNPNKPGMDKVVIYLNVPVTK
jgi:polyisoprenoid-binding protein YceI